MDDKQVSIIYLYPENRKKAFCNSANMGEKRPLPKPGQTILQKFYKNFTFF